MEHLSVDEIVRQCLCTKKQDAAGANGIAKVFLIDEQPDIFIELFSIMKLHGHQADDLTQTHLRTLVNACCPKYKTGAAKKEWDYNSYEVIYAARLVVFRSAYSLGAEPVSQKELAFYSEALAELMSYHKSDHSKEEIRPSKRGEEVDPDDFAMGDESEGDSSRVLLLDPNTVYELVPAPIVDDFSFLPKRKDQ